jgi:hypothetical protein
MFKRFDHSRMDWDAFYSECHLKRVPALLTNGPTMIDDKGVFGAIKRAQAAGGTGIRFIEDGYTPVVIKDEYRVERGVGSLSDWIRQIGVKTGSKEVCFIFNQFSRWISSDEFYSFTDFLDPLFRKTGVPAKEVGLELFLGSYSKTPFGPHLDTADVFCVPVVGPKTFRFWKKNVFGKPYRTHGPYDYSANLAGSFTITAHPGEIIYWPSEYWHTAEEGEGGDGSVRASISIPMFFKRERGELPFQLNKRVFLGLGVDLDDSPETIQFGKDRMIRIDSTIFDTPDLRKLFAQEFRRMLIEKVSVRGLRGPSASPGSDGLEIFWSRHGSNLILARGGQSCVVRATRGRVLWLKSNNPKSLSEFKEIRSSSKREGEEFFRALNSLFHSKMER